MQDACPIELVSATPAESGANEVADLQTDLNEASQNCSDTLRKYLTLLYGSAPFGSLFVFTVPSRRHYSFSLDQLDDAIALIDELGQQQHTYLSWCLHHPGVNTRTNDSAVLVPGFSLDVDLAFGVHKAGRHKRQITNE